MNFKLQLGDQIIHPQIGGALHAAPVLIGANLFAPYGKGIKHARYGIYSSGLKK